MSWRVPGAWARAVRDVNQPHRPKLLAGTVGQLGSLQRVEDGDEVWTFWVGHVLYGVCDKHIEPIPTPKRGDRP